MSPTSSSKNVVDWFAVEW